MKLKYISIIILSIIVFSNCAKKETYSIVTPNTSFKSLKQLSTTIKTPEHLLAWMRGNYSYLRPKEGKMTNWFHLSPQTVFKLKKGDCIHQATFIKYVLSKHGYDGGLLFLNRHNYSDHAVFVWKEDDGKLYFAEPIWNDYRGINGPFSNMDEIGKLIYSWKLKADGKKDKYSLYFYDDVPYGSNWFEFHDRIIPVK